MSVLYLSHSGFSNLLILLGSPLNNTTLQNNIIPTPVCVSAHCHVCMHISMFGPKCMCTYMREATVFLVLLCDNTCSMLFFIFYPQAKFCTFPTLPNGLMGLTVLRSGCNCLFVPLQKKLSGRIPSAHGFLFLFLFLCPMETNFTVELANELQKERAK